MAGRDTGSRPSEIFGIESELAALDFDLACTQRLLQFDNKREFDRLKAFKEAIKEAIGELLGATPPSVEIETENGEIPESDLL